MYPTLNNALVRGFGDDLFLQNYYTNTEIRLDDEMQADILLQCNGVNPVSHILKCANKHLPSGDQLLPEELLTFLQSFSDLNFLVLRECALDKALSFPKLQDPQIYDIQIEATSFCNLKCKHCFGQEHFIQSKKNDLSFELFLEFFKQMEEMNVPNCFLSGGEFFARKEAPQLIKAILNRRISIQGIFTNGTLWRNDIFDAIKELGIDPLILVSLDGFEGSHDKIRGDGNFKKTIDFIKGAVELGFRVNVNTVLNPYNMNEMMDLSQFVDDLGIFRFRVAYPREQGGVAVDTHLMPDDNVYSVFRELLTYFIQYSGEMKVQLSAMYKSELRKNGKYYLYRDTTPTCEYKKHSMALHGNGAMSNCPAALDFSHWRFPETTLKECWESDLMQSIKKLPIKKTECSDCDLRIYCGGGCRIMALSKHGSYLAKDTNQCDFYRFFKKVFVPVLDSAGIESVPLDEAPPYNHDANVIEKSIPLKFKKF